MYQGYDMRGWRQVSLTSAKGTQRLSIPAKDFGTLKGLLRELKRCGVKVEVSKYPITTN